MHIEFCAKLNFLEGEYAITQNIRFLQAEFFVELQNHAQNTGLREGSIFMRSPRDSSKMADYRHRVLTHDNKNPMFCVIAYSPSKKLSLVQNSICMNLASLNLWILYR